MAKASKNDNKVKQTADKVVAGVKKQATKVKEVVVAKTSPKAGQKRKPLSIIIAAALVVLLLVVGTFGVLIYQFKQDSPLVYRVSQVVPYPVMRVNGEFVSYGRFLFDYNSIKQYWPK